MKIFDITLSSIRFFDKDFFWKQPALAPFEIPSSGFEFSSKNLSLPFMNDRNHQKLKN